MSWSPAYAGVDMGSAYTKISMLEPGGGLVRSDPAGRHQVVTAVACDGGGEVLTGFLPLLTTSAAGWAERGWKSGCNPVAATRAFVTALLRDTEGLRDVAGMAVTVPARWLWTAPGTQARERLRSLLADDVGLPVRGLFSAPSCAAAWLLGGPGTTAVAEDPSSGRRAPNAVRLLLVCDIGVDAVEVAFCAIEGRTVRLLDVQTGAEHAGRTFAEAAVCRAYMHVHGREPSGSTLSSLLLAFGDNIRADQDRAVQVLDRAAKDPRWMGARAFAFGDNVRYRLSADDVLSLFTPVAQQVTNLLGDLLRRRADLVMSRPFDGLATGGEGVDDLEVVVVGGLAALPPAQEAVRQATRAALRAAGRAREPVMHTLDSPEYAAARGAALAAAGRVDVIEHYPHELGLRVHHIRDGLLVATSVEVIAPGGVPTDRAAFDGAPIVVGVDGSHGKEVVVDVRIEGRGNCRTVRIPLQDDLPLGDYHVGVQVDRTLLGALVLRPVGGGPARIMALADTSRTEIEW